MKKIEKINTKSNTPSDDKIESIINSIARGFMVSSELLKIKPSN